MANWYGASRTNYFNVKDPAAFRAAMEPLDVQVWDSKERPTLFGLGCGDGCDGDWPSYNPDTDEEFDFIDQVLPHLAEGEVAIFQSSGAEKLRYVTGHATAVNHLGERIDININDIYERAKSQFKVEAITKATY